MVAAGGGANDMVAAGVGLMIWWLQGWGYLW